MFLATLAISRFTPAAAQAEVQSGTPSGTPSGTVIQLQELPPPSPGPAAAGTVDTVYGLAPPNLPPNTPPNIPGVRNIRELPPLGSGLTPAPAQVSLFGGDGVGAVRELEMYVGEGRVLDAPGLARVAVGSGAVITATSLDDRQVLLFANGEGVSSLTAWDRAGRRASVRVTVVPGDTARTLQEIAAFVRTIPSASAQVLGNKVIVDGRDLSDEDQYKLAQLGERYPSIINFASRVGWERMLELSTTVLEVPTSKTSELGVNWAEQTLGGFYAGVAGDYHVDSEITERPGESPITLPFPTAGTNVVAGVNALLSSTISLLVQKGDAVILANPRLTTRSGSAAEFLSGGEIPYLAASATGTPSVQFKPYGVKLSISPVADARTGTIRSVIDTEVSDIDPSLSTSAGPALLTRRTRAEFNVREGETMVLSGFRQRRRSEDVAQIPLLGDIPLVGSLFRSRSFADRETTLVIFVTPRMVEPGSTSVVEQIRDAERRIRELDAPEPKLALPVGRRGPRP